MKSLSILLLAKIRAAARARRRWERNIYSQTTSDQVDRHQEAWEQRRIEQDKQRAMMRDV